MESDILETGALERFDEAHTDWFQVPGGTAILTMQRWNSQNVNASIYEVWVTR